MFNHLAKSSHSIQRGRAFHRNAVRTRAIVTEDVHSRARLRIAKIDAIRPFTPPLVDSFNRRHDYLRISLTERCNLRCFYCMPEEGVELSPSQNILSDDEIIRLTTLFVKSGVTKIRLTGGEPTVRKGLVDLVARLNELRSMGLKSIGMTTNGIALHRKLPQLIANGLTHLNLSLDTLDPFKFEIMTRRPGHEAVLKSLDVALASPALQSVKINAVVIKGLNDSEVPQFVDITKNKNLSVRFIEFMPFTGNKWDKAKMVPSAELLTKISSQYPDVYKLPDETNDTARSYAIPNHRGSFGFISSMSDHFCASCNRLRLTADGQIKVCLFDSKEVSLRDLMRAGVSDEELLLTVRRAVGEKQEKHAGMEDIDVVTNRPMILIGGQIPSTKRATSYPVHGPSINRSLLRGLPVQLSQLVGFTPSRAGTSVRYASKLTHIDERGRPNMVNVSSKEPTKRTATASGRIYIPHIAYELISDSSTSIHRHEPLQKANKDEVVDASLELRKEKARLKGDVLTVAQLAGIMASKRMSDLIPLCHPLALSHVSVNLKLEDDLATKSDEEGKHEQRYSIVCEATVSCEGKTGVEMEALTAVSVSLLTVWDMLKAVAGKDMVIGEIMVTRKTGGKSGDFVRAV